MAAGRDERGDMGSALPGPCAGHTGDGEHRGALGAWERGEGLLDVHITACPAFPPPAAAKEAAAGWDTAQG